MKISRLVSRGFAAVGLAAAALVAFTVYKADRLARIGAGYKAKIACSEIYLAGRDPIVVADGEFDGIDPLMEKIALKIDPVAQSIRASALFGLGHIAAFYREGYGCTLANGGRIVALPALENETPASAPWPEAPQDSGAAFSYVDYATLDAALTDAFENNVAYHRSMLVIVNGKIVDERYADGFSKETPFLSWSMAKSVTATLFGAAAQRGWLYVDDPAPVPEWENDAAKSKITWNDLLRMQSGLRFSEDYDDTRSDVNRMLFEDAEAGAATIRKPLDYKPGDVWYYSSGTANLVARTLQQVLAQHDLTIYAFAREAIFDPIGAASVTLEPDASGGFLGSSFVYATARDWARLGQLYLDGGVWDGARLLPEGWMDYVAVPTKASDGQYGAFFWLNRDGANGRARYLPGLPEDVYYMAGHEGQYVFIIPSKRMIVVRTGMTRGESALIYVAPLLKKIYDAVGTPPVEEAMDAD